MIVDPIMFELLLKYLYILSAIYSQVLIVLN